MPKKSIHTDEDILSVKQAFDGIKGARQIGEELGFTRHKVSKIYEILDIDNSNITPPLKDRSEYKKCLHCNKMLYIEEFRSRLKNNRTYYESICKSCESEYNKKSGKDRYSRV